MNDTGIYYNDKSNAPKKKSRGRTILKWLGIVFGVLLLVIGSGAAYYQYKPPTLHEVKPIDVKVDITDERLQRGEKLASLMCSECHYDPQTGAFTGVRMMDVPEIFGKIWAQNITQDKEHGIGNWSDGDLVRLLRTGLHPSGRVLLPFMLKPKLSDDDMYSLIAFLKSDHEWVRPNPKVDTAVSFSLLGKFLTSDMKPEPMPTSVITIPDSNDKEKLGRYLVTNLLCFGCHSNTMDMNFAEIEKTENFLSGGKEMMMPNGEPVFVPNISKHKQHGIGAWTEDQFVRALRDGFNPQNKVLRPPMPRFTALTESEMRAIYRYIMSAPENPTPRVQPEQAAK